MTYFVIHKNYTLFNQQTIQDLCLCAPGTNPLCTENVRRNEDIMDAVILKKNSDELPAIFHEEQTNYPEYQNKLAELFHNALDTYPYNNTIFLKTRGEKDAGKFFKNKKECKERRNSVIIKAYNEANSHFAIDSSKSVAKEAASFYADFVTNLTAPLCEKLELCDSPADTFPDAFRKLKTLIKHTRKNLLQQFQEELRDNMDYYQMYDLNYFIEQVDIEEHDYNLDTGDKVFDFIARLVNDNTEYTLEGLFDSLNELENDLNKNAASFFSTAFEIYQKYRREIVQIAETIGNDLTDEDLATLEISVELS